MEGEDGLRKIDIQNICLTKGRECVVILFATAFQGFSGAVQ